MVRATSTAPRESTQEQNPSQQPWSVPVKDSDNFFDTPDISEEKISTYHRPKVPSKPPSDSSDSDKSGINNEPPKIPCWSVNRKINLIHLVYDYMDSEII